MFVDSHCHIDFTDLVDLGASLFTSMREAGVSHALCAGVSVERLPGVLAIAEAHANVFCSVGVHPEHTEGEDPDVARLLELAQHPKVVAIGETGLDYYWHKDQPEWQRERFRQHIRAARACDKPLIVHTRDAAADTLRLMREEGAEACGGVMHCFTETWEVASGAMDQGFYISFSGIVTFKNATQIKDVAARMPLDRLLIETDSPYLAPVPYRGKLNQPAYVPYVAHEIAKLRGISVDEVAEASTNNFFRLFKDAAR
ncbi:TatD family hydrolase [Niveibacterium umoris]|uniref:TatD DNase family protein n=1 Tax=Niveibacterium umoris TaxID=1193620 RepID=A0A840BD94_9RHOO|nr:TatD family hydrolase [Niveibacterium umoris]MBB4011491.1 TatD DNase family protein [Niveibacterium umoris]